MYGLKSSLMDGPSRWNILSDTDLSNMLPEVLLRAPEIVSGFLQNEVEALFQQWNPLIWHVIKASGIFVSDAGAGDARSSSPGGFMAKLTSLLRTRLIDRIRQARADANGDAHISPPPVAIQYSRNV